MYKIKVDETKLNQAATLAHLMLAHATVLSFHLFLETVMLTVEGKLEKFKDGQVCQLFFCALLEVSVVLIAVATLGVAHSVEWSVILSM